MAAKGLEKVAKAIRYHQKEIQLSFDPSEPEGIEGELWKANLLIDALETLSGKIDELPKISVFEVLTE